MRPPRKGYAEGYAQLSVEFYRLLPGFDLMAFLERLGVTLYLRDLGSSQGFSWRDEDGERIICLNSSLPEPKLRWTGVHEAGHHMLGHHEEMKTWPEWWKRVEANAYTSAVIMPEQRFIDFCERATSAKAVAFHFGTSIQAVFFRVDNLHKVGKMPIPIWAQNPPEWAGVSYAARRA